MKRIFFILCMTTVFGLNGSLEFLREYPLHFAAKEHRMDLIKDLSHNKHVNINKKDKDGKTALHVAAEENFLEAIKYLLNLGADINAVDKDDFTPLLSAVDQQNVGAVDVLLKAGANPSMSFKSKISPYYLAWIYKNPEIVALLKKAGASEEAFIMSVIKENNAELMKVLLLRPEMEKIIFKMPSLLIDKERRFILHMVVAESKYEVLDALLEVYPSGNIKDVHGKTPLHYIGSIDKETGLPLSTRENYKKIIHRLIAAGDDIDVKDSNGKTPLAYALENQNIPAVEALMDVGMELFMSDHSKYEEFFFRYVFFLFETNNLSAIKEYLDTQLRERIITKKFFLGNECKTFLHVAVEDNKLEIVALLLRYGVEADAKDGNGQTALDRAITLNHKSMIKLLLQTKYGLFKFINAVKEGDLEKVKFFVEHGVDVNGINHYTKDPHFFLRNHTALHEAVFLKNVDIIKFLLEKKADIGKKLYGKTPLSLAIEAKDPTLVNLLIAEGIQNASHHPLLLSIGQQMCTADKKFICDIIDLLIKRGVDINIKNLNSAEDSILHEAVQKGKGYFVKFLISRGANVNATGRCNQTPLFDINGRHACTMANVLIKNGAHLNVKNSLGETPLLQAVSYKKLDLIKFFVEQGADIHIRNMNENTLLHTIMFYPDRDILLYFLEKGLDINAKNKQGDTPLHVAFREGKWEMAKILIQNHCLWEEVNKQNQSPLDILYEQRNQQVINDFTQFIEQNGRPSMLKQPEMD